MTQMDGKHAQRDDGRITIRFGEAQGAGVSSAQPKGLGIITIQSSVLKGRDNSPRDIQHGTSTLAE